MRFASTFQEKSILRDVAFEAAVQSGVAMAMWRLPYRQVIHCIADFSDHVIAQPFDLNEATEGFVVSPFLNEQLQHTYFIKADWRWSSEEEATPFRKEFPNDKEAQFQQHWEKQLQGAATNQVPPITSSFTEQSKLAYQSLVEKAITEIKANRLRKVVTSRRQAVHFSDIPSATVLFEKLHEAYPSAFISLVHLPGVGTWLGASPEVLISVDTQQILRTMALAGTQPYQSNKPLSEAVWTQKEIEEQALVSRYIINCFKKVRVREFEEEGPKTVRAGNLLHLRTDFWVDLAAIDYPQLPDIMLRLLHPTSAVCGMPLQESLAFLATEETYERQFYSGFLGPVGDTAQLFVNLRCMQLLGKKAYLYAGGGVTVDSQSEKEWQETVMKCETLLRILSD
ncbi:MAG: chorismate-binding protein [Bacteroidota bacterium]